MKHYNGEVSVKVVADSLGMTTKEVWAIQQRALYKLRKNASLLILKSLYQESMRLKTSRVKTEPDWNL